MKLPFYYEYQYDREFPYPDLQKFPLVGRTCAYFDEMVGKYGLSKGIHTIIWQTGNSYEVIGLTTRTELVLQQKGVLVIGNHPFDAEPIFVLGALPARTDISVISASNQLGLGPHIAKHVLPVWVGKHERVKEAKLSVRMVRKLNLISPLNPEEAHQKNIKTISAASTKICQGEAVVMFPEGTKGKQGKWLPGIGYLLHDIGTKPKTYVVMTYTKGTSNLDYLRLLPQLPRFLIKPRVYFSEPIAIRDILLKVTEPKEIKDYLESLYQQWVQTLESEPAPKRQVNLAPLFWTVQSLMLSLYHKIVV